MSQGNMGAPLYRYTGQVGPRFGKSGSLVEWKWCHNIMVESVIHFRPLHKSIVNIYEVFQPLVCCLTGIWLHPYTVTPAELAPDLGSQGHLWSENDAIMSWLRLKSTSDLLHTSIEDINKVFQPLVWCLEGIWVHPYIVTPAKLAPDLGSQVHFWSKNDATTSWLRLISTSDHFIHPY